MWSSAKIWKPSESVSAKQSWTNTAGWLPGPAWLTASPVRVGEEGVFWGEEGDWKQPSAAPAPVFWCKLSELWSACTHQERFPLRQNKQLVTVLYVSPKALSLHDSHSMKTHQNRNHKTKQTIPSSQWGYDRTNFCLSLSCKQLVMFQFQILCHWWHRLKQKSLAGLLLNQGQLAGASDGKSSISTF